MGAWEHMRVGWGGRGGGGGGGGGGGHTEFEWITYTLIFFWGAGMGAIVFALDPSVRGPPPHVLPPKSSGAEADLRESNRHGGERAPYGLQCRRVVR